MKSNRESKKQLISLFEIPPIIVEKPVELSSPMTVQKYLLEVLIKLEL